MILWRAARERYADLSGKGALYHSGRWHSEGVPVVYTAEHPALALLEVRVNLDLPKELAPNDYVMMKIFAPDGLSVATADVSPEDRASARRAGDAWLAGGASALFKAPSVIAPESHNYLINPAHPDAANIRVSQLFPFAFDARLFG